VFDLVVISAKQFDALVDSVKQAVEDWRPTLDADGLLLEDEPTGSPVKLADGSPGRARSDYHE
jgi:hypothetical protein